MLGGGARGRLLQEPPRIPLQRTVPEVSLISQESSGEDFLPPASGEGPPCPRPYPPHLRRPPPADRLPFASTPQNSPRFQQTSSGFQQTSSGFQQTSPGFPQNSPRFQQTSSGFQQTSPGFQQTSPGFPQNSPRFPQNSPRFQQTSSGFQQTSPGFQETSPGFQQSASGFQETLVTPSPSVAHLTPGRLPPIQAQPHTEELFFLLEEQRVQLRDMADAVHRILQGQSQLERTMQPSAPTPPPCPSCRQRQVREAGTQTEHETATVGTSTSLVWGELKEALGELVGDERSQPDRGERGCLRKVLGPYNHILVTEEEQREYRQQPRPPSQPGLVGLTGDGGSLVVERTRRQIRKNFGVSFIDGLESPGSNKGAGRRMGVDERAFGECGDFASTYVPKVNYMSLVMDEEQEGVSYVHSHRGAEWDSLSAKYLQEPVRQDVEGSPSSASSSGVTVYGMSLKNVSFATQRYLRKYGLLDSDVDVGEPQKRIPQPPPRKTVGFRPKENIPPSPPSEGARNPLQNWIGRTSPMSSSPESRSPARRTPTPEADESLHLDLEALKRQPKLL
ncbi:unnamed protein product [Cyprideis torosa]|uniref:Uncharacterized protein n=1 Tax=Cyprideis torosa TaxID=163714 RepID=A0A7R8ZNM3_9CRUS|nr:unnamed protein product [Cyprideis torosa]CAG0888083.1 unnamed protein product [Cyprideis torosa]